MADAGVDNFFRNIDSRKRIWRPRAHFGSENESLKGLINILGPKKFLCIATIFIEPGAAS